MADRVRPFFMTIVAICNLFPLALLEVSAQKGKTRRVNKPIKIKGFGRFDAHCYWRHLDRESYSTVSLIFAVTGLASDSAMALGFCAVIMTL